MTTPPGTDALRWPLHPSPGPVEALSSWLGRTARLYGLAAGDLLRHNLGSAPSPWPPATAWTWTGIRRATS